mmetsp:Transcript_3144/g.7476  ORF Transcript_3144/g.7476 Transcript_3144/m.7476 type:complete len:202 (+) Transcript_3144:18-623(+)
MTALLDRPAPLALLLLTAHMAPNASNGEAHVAARVLLLPAGGLLELGGGFDGRGIANQLPCNLRADGEGVAAQRGEVAENLGRAHRRDQHARAGSAPRHDLVHRRDCSYPVHPVVSHSSDVGCNVLCPCRNAREHLVRGIAGSSADAHAQPRQHRRRLDARGREGDFDHHPRVYCRQLPASLDKVSDALTPRLAHELLGTE